MNNYNYLNAYISNATNTSLQLNFYGSYNSSTIYRNNVIITKNAMSPFVDTGLSPNIVYSYVIVPYDSSGNSGTRSIAYGTTTSNINILSLSSVQYANNAYYIPSNATGFSVVNAYIQNQSFIPNDIFNPKYGYMGIICTTGLIYWTKGYLNPTGVNPKKPIFDNITYGITWDTNPTPINDGNYRNYTGVALTSDAKKFVVCSTTYCYYSVFSGFNNSWYSPTVQTLDTVTRNYSGICMTDNGDRIIVSVNGNFIYFANWVPTSSGGNYSMFYKTLENVQRNYSAIDCSSDGKKLVYCVNPGYVYYSTWNGINYNIGGQINLNTIYSCNGIQLSPDGQNILLGVYTNNAVIGGYTQYTLYNTDVMMSKYNLLTNTYDTFTTLSTNFVNTDVNYQTNAFCLSSDGIFLFIIPYYHIYFNNSGIMQIPVNYGYYSNTNQPYPVINTAGITDYTGDSITLNFTGVFNYVTITRNGVLIVPNPSNSPYIDNNLLGNTSYSYIITPYSLSGVAGVPSDTISQQTRANILTIIASQTTNSVSLSYSGYFSYVTILRNSFFTTNYYLLNQYNDTNLPIDTNYTYTITPYNIYNQAGIPLSINTSTLPIIYSSSVLTNVGIIVTLYYPGDFGYVTITYNGVLYSPNPTTDTTVITNLQYNSFYTFVMTPYSLNNVVGYSFTNTAFTSSKLDTYSVSTIGTTFVYISFSGIFFYVVISQNGINYPRQITTSPFTGIVNLIPNTSYDYIITTYNLNSVPGQYSPTLTIVTLPLITSISIGSVTTSTITVNLTGYFLYVIYTYYAAPYNFPALGLVWNSYIGYYNGNVYYATTSTELPGLLGASQGITYDFTNLAAATSNNWVHNSGQINFTIVWTGYLFTKTYSGNWSFTVSSDDQCFIWIGQNALSGYLSSNANCNVNVSVQTFNVTLVSNTYYPIRILYGQSTGSYNLIISVTPPGGQLFTSGYGYYYDSSGTTIQLDNSNNTIVTS